MGYIFLWLSSPYVAWQNALKAWPMGFQDPAIPVMQGIIDLHGYICFFLIVILSLVLWMLIRTLYFFHESQNPIPEKIIHGTSIEIAWTVAPSLILILIAVPSFALLYSMDQVVDPVIAVSVILGLIAKLSFLLCLPLAALCMEQPNLQPPIFVYVTAQGYTFSWRYNILGTNKVVHSYRRTDDLSEVENPLLLPINRLVVFLITSADVKCDWTLPALRISRLAAPDRVTTIATTFSQEGVYVGAPDSQFEWPNFLVSVPMPIEVQAVSQPEYDDWVNQ